jgi:putative copper export protein
MAAVKIIWVAVLLAIAMINKFWLTPLLMNENSNTIPQLRYSIIAEIAIAGIILLVTACFTTLVGPA